MLPYLCAHPLFLGSITQDMRDDISTPDGTLNGPWSHLRQQMSP